MGCDLLVQALEHAGVDTIFAYPGGASMMLHQSLTRSKKIRTILPRPKNPLHIRPTPRRQLQMIS